MPTTTLDLPRYEVVEALGDGRAIVIEVDGPHRGTVFVIGDSDREPEAARMGRLPVRAVTVHRAARATVRPTPTHSPPPRTRPSAREEADAKAEALFESLLDAAQLAQWQRTRRCWVATPRGPVRLGVAHDLRFRPHDDPDHEWSLCVVPTGRPLPAADVWSNLLLVLAVDPERFFTVANVAARDLRPTPPHPPRVERSR